MLDSLTVLAVKQKNELKTKLNILLDNVPDVSKYWNEHIFIKDDQKIILAAGDGSRNKKKFLSHIFYAISAETLIHQDNELKKEEYSLINIMSHHRFVSDRLRNYMSLLELKTALKSFKCYDIDYYLYDGSILGNLIRPIPLENELNRELKEKIKKFYEKKLEEELEKVNVEICTSKFEEDISINFENKIESTVYLENIETLLTISKLLKEPKKIVAISKTSTSKDYKSEIPDMALFDMNSHKQGFSDPRYVNLSDSKEVKRDFSVKNRFFRGFEFTIFYARLENNKNILKFELPYHAEKEDIISLLSILKSKSTEGYPYLLKRAHDDVKISKMDLERLVKIIGHNGKSGREVVDGQ